MREPPRLGAATRERRGQSKKPDSGAAGARSARQPSVRRKATSQRLRFPRAPLVGPALDTLLAQADRRAQLASDPLGTVHRYSDAADRELVGILASSVAYGRVSLFLPRLSRLLDELGPSPASLVQKTVPNELLELCGDFAYRMTDAPEVAALLHAAATAQSRHGSLGRLAENCFDRANGDMRETLAAFVDEIWSADLRPFTRTHEPTRRLKHLLSSPRAGSASKRLNLYVRWMVRGPDGADLGLWDLPRSALVIPLDTHVHRISGFLGLTRRKDLSWRTAEEITARLRQLDPHDPVKYDFALAHLGISGRCPSRADPERCGDCPLRGICRMWDRPKPRE